MIIDVDSVIKLSALELCPDSVPPSVVRDMATALRILTGPMNADSPREVIEWFGFLNDAPLTLQQHIDLKHGNHL